MKSLSILSGGGFPGGRGFRRGWLRPGLFLRPLRWSAELGPTPRRCQWLEGDGPFRDEDKCGRGTVAGSAYCARHLQLSRQRRRAAGRSALQPAD